MFSGNGADIPPSIVIPKKTNDLRDVVSATTTARTARSDKAAFPMKFQFRNSCWWANDRAHNRRYDAVWDTVPRTYSIVSMTCPTSLEQKSEGKVWPRASCKSTDQNLEANKNTAHFYPVNPSSHASRDHHTHPPGESPLLSGRIHLPVLLHRAKTLRHSKACDHLKPLVKPGKSFHLWV